MKLLFLNKLTQFSDLLSCAQPINLIWHSCAEPRYHIVNLRLQNQSLAGGDHCF